MPEFNVPAPNDPNFNEKVVNLLSRIFEQLEKITRDYKPIQDPEDALQVGSSWFNESENKIKINTSEGVKTIQYEP